MSARALYAQLVRLLVPFALARLLWRSRRAPAYRRRWRERLGYGAAVPGRPLWVHAVSVGEVMAALPLIDAFRARHPDVPLLVTTTTPTGAERVADRLGQAVIHRYLPFDAPGAVRRFLDLAEPRLGIVMETEIWPNLIAAAEARGLPMVLANARLSARSARGYARFPALVRPALRGFAAVAAQTQADAERLCALGASPERVEVTGSVKFDQRLPAAQREAGQGLRAQLGAGRPVWVAASTHEGEEIAALAAHRRLRDRLADAALILVPRHPERFDGVAAETRRAGWTPVRRSRGEVPDTDAAVFLGDTMGELPLYLAAADVVFMGGSLVAVGGHNMLEPAALGLPVLTGPQVFNFQAVAELLDEAAALRYVDDAESLATALAELLADAPERDRMGRAGAEVVAAHRGACERTLALVEPLLP
ncbi:lipid IV(A) 3-deoxy-D-manno-octulosonic acid transferase [Sediminicurvatus halobius]|uniref:3-deoxy-D-manno-octulosonic acid transferase n=1 Tax=Sediminicurvatus halobius TaxID=2182432 RepID=A0A2U2N6R8_9GAMM|nr:lipid IV(A) 3-deoxy-D-manno-octulosonic acid transferase [Spiribacter halobius]PWG64895.1 3-deoxy-D-manno-octulosonic acid transferase [Spiribacter halobius]UEX78250.1 lipid IV(A) 3-deoxy-D-manno-octulosonic acid transferase [Spiribacter halobius]